MCNCKQNEFELLPELEAMLGNYAGAYHNEYEAGVGNAGGKGTTVAASPSFVRNFSGPGAECSAALTQAGKTQAQALAIINTQIASAIKMLRFAAGKLKQGSRTTQTNKLFQRIFRVPPTFVPTWFKPTATIKDRGDIVAVRCLRVADLIASGSIRFFCSVTNANCPGCVDSNDPNVANNNPSLFACSSFGNNEVICLGVAFWEAMKNDELDSMRATLMHEPFHIYYGVYVTEHDITEASGVRHVGKFGGIRCILQFVFEINGQRAQDRDRDFCGGTVVRK